ncbi:MAG: glycosyltransferase family 2 protein [Deltaproteobacteria bacterium]|nr:glycosyltransferase family 2 protein [Deltaproteobacteria bacterium]
MKKTSVIIPVYNMERFIKEAILSALTQRGISLDSLEIIAINDGSKDGSKRVIEELAREFCNIRMIDLKENSGVLTAVIEGLKAAKGDYICLLDADDLWMPGKLSEVIGCFEAGYHLVFHEGEFVDAAGNPLHKETKCTVDDNNIAYNIKTFNGGIPLGSNISFVRNKLDMDLLISVYNRFKDKKLERLVHQDTSILHALVTQDDLKIKCIRKKLYSYRIHGGNNSQHSDFEDLERLRNTYEGWMTSIQFAIEIYKISGLFYRDKSIELGFQKFLYHKNLTFKEKPLMKLWSDYIFLLRNRAFSSSNEKLREALYPFFYRLSPRLRGFVRRRVQL